MMKKILEFFNTFSYIKYFFKLVLINIKYLNVIF